MQMCEKPSWLSVQASSRVLHLDVSDTLVHSITKFCNKSTPKPRMTNKLSTSWTSCRLKYHSSTKHRKTLFLNYPRQDCPWSPKCKTESSTQHLQIRDDMQWNGCTMRQRVRFMRLRRIWWEVCLSKNTDSEQRLDLKYSCFSRP